MNHNDIYGNVVIYLFESILGGFTQAKNHNIHFYMLENWSILILFTVAANIFSLMLLYIPWNNSWDLPSDSSGWIWKCRF